MWSGLHNLKSILHVSCSKYSRHMAQRQCETLTYSALAHWHKVHKGQAGSLQQCNRGASIKGPLCNIVRFEDIKYTKAKGGW